MPSIITASTASNTALNFSADTSGVLEIRTGSSPTTALTISTAQVATFANDAVISGLTVGRGGGSQITNTVVGNGALNAVNSGIGHNTAIGYQAIFTNTTGTNLDAVGAYVLNKNTTGLVNTGMGGSNTIPALYNNTTGSYNVAYGVGSLFSNTTASNNTAVGYQAAYSTTTGGQNTAVGNGSLFANTTGVGNTSIGLDSLRANTTASYNTGLGFSAATSTTTGSGITAVGSFALLSNTTGNANVAIGGVYPGVAQAALYSNTTGSFNIGIGTSALFSNTTGSFNTGLGFQSGVNNTTGQYNTFVGYRAGNSVTTGSANVIIGNDAGYFSTGSSNTFIGGGIAGVQGGAGVLMTTGSKNVIIGNFVGNSGGLDIRTASNNVVISDGDGNPYVYWDSVGRSTFRSVGVDNQLNMISSAAAYSTRIQMGSAGGGGAVIASSNNVLTCQTGGTGGVSLNSGATSWVAASDERVKENLQEITDAANKVASLRAVTGNYTWDESKKKRAFLIAQDVLEVLPEAVETKNPDELGLAYTDTIPLLVAAIKELKAEVDSLKAQLNNGA